MGEFNGEFENVNDNEMGEVEIKDDMESDGVDEEDVDEVIMGKVMKEGEGKNKESKEEMGEGWKKEKKDFEIKKIWG